MELPPPVLPRSQAGWLRGWWAPHFSEDEVQCRLLATGVDAVGGTWWAAVTAVSSVTGLSSGVLVPLLGCGPASGVPLAVGTAVLTTPTAMVSLPGGGFAIVGTGTQDGGATTHPTVAVCGTGGTALRVSVGAGLSELPAESWVAAALVPGNPATMWVVGSGADRATLRLLSLESLLPLPFSNGLSALQWEGDAGGGGGHISVATCLVPVTALGILLVGVLDVTLSTSAIWSLELASGAPLPPTATGYNSQAYGGMLAPPPATVGLLLLQLLAYADGSVLAVSTGLGDPASAFAPPSFVVISAFGPDTTPNPSWGGGAGFLTWALPGMGSARPVAAVALAAGCAPPGGVVVVGNCWASEVAAPGPGVVAVTVPGKPWATTLIQQEEAGGGTDPLLVQPAPVPFVVTLRPAAPPRLDVLMSPASPDQVDPVAPYVVATAASALVPWATVGFAGDVATRPRAPNQPVTFLSGSAAVSGGRDCTPSVAVWAPVLSDTTPPPFQGLVTVDNRAGSTMLVVNGPVVVGQSPAAGAAAGGFAPLPGALRFNPAAATFEGFDGTQWRALAFI